MKKWIFDTFYAEEKETIYKLYQNVEELKSIGLDQIFYSRELEDKIARLEDQVENLEIALESLSQQSSIHLNNVLLQK